MSVCVWTQGGHSSRPPTHFLWVFNLLGVKIKATSCLVFNFFFFAFSFFSHTLDLGISVLPVLLKKQPSFGILMHKI